MKLKVAIITQDIRNFGGVSTHVRFVYGFLERLGFKPYVINYATRKYDNRLNKALTNPFREIKTKQTSIKGMRVIIIGCYFPEFEFMRYLSNHLWKATLEKFDAFIVVCGSSIFGYPLAQLSKRYVLWVGTTALDDRKDRIKGFSLPRRILSYVVLPFVRLEERRTLLRAYRILATTNYTKKCLIREFGIKNISILHIPVDTNKFFPLKDVYNKKKPFILFVGRVNDPRKNILLLIRAFKIVKNNTQFPLKLIIAGEKPSAKLINLCGEDIGKSIVFKGKVDEKELVGLYRKASVFVLPSLQEGCGLALLEAMAADLPVIATKCGGPEEIIRNHETGILVENNNIKSLANAILYLINNPQVCKNMGKNARRFVEREYNLKTIEKNFTRILKEVYPNLYKK